MEDARRTCESRDARIASLLFDPPPALPAREPPDRLAGLQQQGLELQAVLQEKEASVQALRLRATFTQPEEARLESRRLLQESVRLQLELKAKRAQRASSSAKDNNNGLPKAACFQGADFQKKKSVLIVSLHSTVRFSESQNFSKIATLDPLYGECARTDF